MTTAPEDARREGQELLDGDLEQTLPGVWGKSLNSEDVILPKGVHGHQGGAGRVGRQERRGLVRSGALGVPPAFFLYRFPLPKAI